MDENDRMVGGDTAAGAGDAATALAQARARIAELEREAATRSATNAELVREATRLAAECEELRRKLAETETGWKRTYEHDTGRLIIARERCVTALLEISRTDGCEGERYREIARRAIEGENHG